MRKPSPAVSAALKLWGRRIVVAGLVAVGLGYLPYHVYASSGLARYLKLRSDRDTLHAGNVKLAVENQRLRRELDALADDSGGELSRAAVERAARDELGLVRPGEIVFELEGRP
jgi:cell division protein FtsB